MRSPTKEELKQMIVEQKKTIKTLQQKLRRKEKKMENMSKLIADFKEQNLVNKYIACSYIK